MVLGFKHSEFSRRLIEERQKLDVSVNGLSNLTGVPAYTIKRMEAGMNVHFGSAIVVCYFLDIHPADYVLDEEGLVGAQKRLPI